MKREVFEKWDLLPLSHSKLSSFKHFPCQFIINKIYKLDTGDNPSMSAGRNVEKALYRYIVEGAKSKQDIISECIDQFVADMQPYEYDTNIIKKFCEIRKINIKCFSKLNEISDNALKKCMVDIKEFHDLFLEKIPC